MINIIIVDDHYDDNNITYQGKNGKQMEDNVSSLSEYVKVFPARNFSKALQIINTTNRINIVGFHINITEFINGEKIEYNKFIDKWL